MSETIDPLGVRKDLDEIFRESQRLAVVGQFAASVMHEINNPLEAVSNLNFLIQQDAKNTGQVLEYSRIIEKQLAQVFQIARRTLSFYRPEDCREVVAIATLADAALQVHREKISQKQVKLFTHFPEGATVKVHPGEMLQVISNLVSNAVDALPVKGTLCLR